MDNNLPQETIPQPIVPSVVAPAPDQRKFLFPLIIILVLTAVVGAGAYYIGLAKSQTTTPKTVVATPSVVPSPTPDPTADWKEYKNYTYNFSLKFPKEWEAQPPEISTNRFAMNLRLAGTKTTIKNVGDYSSGANIDIVVDNETAQEIIIKSSGVDKKQTITIANNSATRLTGTSGVAGTVSYVTAIIPYNGKTYTLSVTTQDTVIEAQAHDDFNQILSTFKFTTNNPLPEVVQKAKEDLASKLGIPAVQIITQYIEEMNWSNSSLGCPEAGKVYTQAIVPGYKAVFENNAKTYEYHTNLTSSFAQCTSK